ncbi:MAG TPA: ribonuclease H family protein [Fluviicola sp.]|nr:ribonuclease H family protein [Fluviicola sp.]
MTKKKKPKFYTVWVGRKPGVYQTWEECERQVSGFERAEYKSFPTLEEAETAYRNNSVDYIGKDESICVNTKLIEKVGMPIQNSICVDGAWNTKTNAIEYQGVTFPEKNRIFHAGPFPVGTNNIAEFLAIVHALSYCKANLIDSIIYSDSHTAITWVLNKRAKTKIEHSGQTSHILSIIDRAEKWLQNNTYSNQIMKWHTEAWGENPADFGRK